MQSATVTTVKELVDEQATCEHKGNKGKGYEARNRDPPQVSGCGMEIDHF